MVNCATNKTNLANLKKECNIYIKHTSLLYEKIKVIAIKDIIEIVISYIYIAEKIKYTNKLYTNWYTNCLQISNIEIWYFVLKHFILKFIRIYV